MVKVVKVSTIHTRTCNPSPCLGVGVAGGQLPVEPYEHNSVKLALYCRVPPTAQLLAHHLDIVHLLGIVEGNDQVAISCM